MGHFDTGDVRPALGYVNDVITVYVTADIRCRFEILKTHLRYYLMQRQATTQRLSVSQP